MGWLYMKSLEGHSGPRQYLDAQFAYDRPDLRSRVLKSSVVGKRVYYAAIEHRRSDGARAVFGAVCLVRYNRRARDGYIFGYKDMTECMGPVESHCPTTILDLLTPTTSAYALAWRERCRANAGMRRASARKPTLQAGQFIVFDEPLTFSDGRTLDRFEVLANSSGTGTVFRDPELGKLYRVSKVKQRGYRLIASAAEPLESCDQKAPPHDDGADL